jgi:DNA-binding IclR family transcriptional regulator
VLEAHCTAVGKMLLAGLPADEIATHYSANTTLPAMTPASILDETFAGWLAEAYRIGAGDHLTANAYRPD